MSLRTLGKQSLIYGFGHILARMVTFLLLPLYTNVFSAADYGIISLIYTFLGFMTVVLHYGLDASLMKNYVPTNRSERKSILTNVYFSFAVTSFFFCIALVALKDYTSIFLFGAHLPGITIMVAGILFFDVLWSIHVLILRAEEKPIPFVGVSFANVILTMGLNIFFVIYLDWGINGVVWSNLITSGLLFFATSPVILRRLSIKTISWIKWKKLMRFGAPFLPAGIFSMILELSDRYILKYLTNIETVGVYNAGYKLGMLMLLIVMGFNMGWQPYFLKQDKNDTNYVAKTMVYLIAILGFVWILLVLWVDDLVQFQIGNYSFFGKDFGKSTQIVPLIAGAYIFHAMYLVQLPGVYLKEKSGWVAIVRGIGALSNIALNFLLIPKYGIVGAASATFIAFFLMAVFMYFLNTRIFPVKYEWYKILIVVVTSLGVLFIFQKVGLSFVEKTILSLCYPLVLFVFGVIRIRKIKPITNH